MAIVYVCDCVIPDVNHALKMLKLGKDPVWHINSYFLSIKKNIATPTLLLVHFYS